MELSLENVEKFLNNKLLYQDLGKIIKNKFREERKWIPFNSDKVNDFYRANNIFLERNSSEEFKWNSGIKQRFYDVIGNHVLKDDLIQIFNQEYSKYALNIENDNGEIGLNSKELIKGLNYIEEIDKFLNVYQYQSIKKEILEKSIKLLVNTDLKNLKKISNALNNDIDSLTILSILNNDTLEESFKTLDVEKIVKDVENEKETVSTAIGGLITASTAIALSQYDVCVNYLTNFSQEKLNEGIEKSDTVIKFAQQNLTNYYNEASNYFNQGLNYLVSNFPSIVNVDKVALSATVVGIVGIYLGGKLTGAVFKNYYEGRKSNKVGVMDIDKCNEDNYKFFTKSRLISGITKYKDLNTENDENKKHIILLGFLIDKLENKHKKISDYNKDGNPLKTILGLSNEEEERLNNITLNEIATISQINNPELRETMMKNRFSQDDVLLARQFDNLQKIYGLNLLKKGEYFKQIEERNISKSINNHLTSCSPIKRVVIRDYIRNLADKENKYAIVSNINYINFSKKINEGKLNNNVDLINFITKGLESVSNKNESIKDLIIKNFESKSQYHNGETRDFINKQFEEMKFNCASSIDNFSKIEDTAFFRTKTIVKNVTTNMINKLRSTFHTGSTTTPGTP